MARTTGNRYMAAPSPNLTRGASVVMMERPIEPSRRSTIMNQDSSMFTITQLDQPLRPRVPTNSITAQVVDVAPGVIEEEKEDFIILDPQEREKTAE